MFYFLGFEWDVIVRCEGANLNEMLVPCSDAFVPLIPLIFITSIYSDSQ